MLRGEKDEPYKLEEFLIQWDKPEDEPEEADEPAKHHTVTAFEQMFAAKRGS